MQKINLKSKLENLNLMQECIIEKYLINLFIAFSLPINSYISWFQQNIWLVLYKSSYNTHIDFSIYKYLFGQEK